MVEIRDVGVALEAPDSSEEAIDRMGLLRLMLTFVFCGVVRSTIRRDEETSAVRDASNGSDLSPWRCFREVGVCAATFSLRTGDGSPRCRRSTTSLLFNDADDCDETMLELVDLMREGADAAD